MENNKNKKSVKFQGDMLNFCVFIQVFVFTRNHHLNGPLRQYFILYQAVFQRGRKKKEMRHERKKMSKHPPLAHTASAVGPCPTIIAPALEVYTAPSHYPITPSKFKLLKFREYFKGSRLKYCCISKLSPKS